MSYEFPEQQVTDAQLAEIAAMQEHESTHLDTGLKEKALFEVQEAWYEKNAEYNKKTGNDATTLRWVGADRNDGERFEFILSLGKDVEPGDYGKVAVLANGKKSFHVKSSIGMLIDSIATEKKALLDKKIKAYRFGPQCYREILTKDATQADTWIGHVWEMGMIQVENVNRDRESGEEKTEVRRRLFPVRYVEKVGAAGSPSMPGAPGAIPGAPPVPGGGSVSASAPGVPGAPPAPPSPPAPPAPPAPPRPPAPPAPPAPPSALGRLDAQMQQVIKQAAAALTMPDQLTAYVMDNGGYFAAAMSDQVFASALASGQLWNEARA